MYCDPLEPTCDVHITDYSRHYSDSKFWTVVRSHRALSFLSDALALFYCLKDHQTPAWVKGLIVGALGYFILPIDAVPDVLPVVGWLDDGGIITGIIAVIRAYIRPEHRQQARQFLGAPFEKSPNPPVEQEE